MNRKQLTIIVVLGVLVGGLGLFLYQRNTTSWKSTGQGSGQSLLGEFPINEVASVTIKQVSNSVTIARTAARADTMAVSSIVLAVALVVLVAAARLAVGPRSW